MRLERENPFLIFLRFQPALAPMKETRHEHILLQAAIFHPHLRVRNPVPPITLVAQLKSTKGSKCRP